MIGQIGNGPFGKSWHRAAPKEAVFQDVAGLIVICESVTNCHMSCGVGHAGSGAGSTTGWHSRRFTHDDGMNVAYYDGHVKFHKKDFSAREFGVD